MLQPFFQFSQRTSTNLVSTTISNHHSCRMPIGYRVVFLVFRHVSCAGKTPVVAPVSIARLEPIQLFGGEPQGAICVAKLHTWVSQLSSRIGLQCWKVQSILAGVFAQILSHI